MRLATALALAVLLTALPVRLASAQQANYSPEIEAKGREVGESLRCVVCQNQSIEQSGAPLAADMRRLVRERLAAGDTPDQVRAFMTQRYGNFVLMKPPFQADTLLLWLGPFLFLALAAGGYLIYLRPRTRRASAPAPLTDAERAELARRLGEEADA
jgi:cytochrome c-type biogenesis protein CcmH